MSSWASAPPRGLEAPRRRPATAGGFTPRLKHDPLRSKAKTSGYGQVTPTKAPPQGLTTEQKALREATFKPNLRPSKLRDRAQSSGYGKAVVGRKPASAPETPSFKPRMSNTATARRILQQAPSAGYGKEDVKLAPHKTHDGAPSQQLCSLRLPPDPLRQRTRSSGYGDGYTPQVRPRTAPSRSAVLQHSLCADRPEGPKARVSPPADRPAFVSDGVHVALASHQAAKYGLKTADDVRLYGKTRKSIAAQRLLDKAASSGYGRDWNPETNRSPDVETAPEGVLRNRAKGTMLKGGRDTTYIEGPVAPPDNPVREQMKQSVPSSGYTGSDYEPAVAERREVEPAPPAFSVPKSPGIAPLSELETPVVAATVSGSSGYGVMSPEPVPTPEPVGEPLWLPPGPCGKGIPPLDCISPPPPPSQDTFLSPDEEW